MNVVEARAMLDGLKNLVEEYSQTIDRDEQANLTQGYSHADSYKMAEYKQTTVGMRNQIWAQFNELGSAFDTMEYPVIVATLQSEAELVPSVSAFEVLLAYAGLRVQLLELESSLSVSTN